MNIDQMKLLGQWPPHNNIGVVIAPELRRMKRDIEVLDIGVGRGESIVYLNENVPNISKIYGLVHTNEHDDVIEENMKNIEKVDRVYRGQMVDAFLITLNEDITVELLELYYSRLNHGGVFVGDQFTNEKYKKIIFDFRRKNKITMNVNIIQKDFWFWKKT